MKKVLFLSLALMFVLTGCGKKPVSDIPGVDEQHPLVIPVQKFEQSPMVEKYRSIKECEGRTDREDCYANHAVWEENPSLCSKMVSGLDSLCLQYYYIQRNDPKACEKLPNKGAQAACNEYFKNGKK